MELVFAKWIFTAAAVLAGGPGQDLPIMRQVTEPIPQIHQRIAQSTVYWIPCPPVPVGVVAPPCTPQPTPALGFQLFCTAPGVYTFTVRLGLIAQEPMGGKVWLVGPSGARSLLAAFNAAPGMPAYVAASLQAQSAAYDACYTIQLDGNRAVELIADPAVSFLTIGR